MKTTLKPVFTSLLGVLLAASACFSMPKVTWTRLYGGPDYDTGKDLVRLPNSRFAFTGSSGPVGGDLDVFLRVVNSQGQAEITVEGLGGNSLDRAMALTTTPDGGFLIAGYTYSFGPGREVLLVRLGESGELVWQQSFGLAGNDMAFDILRAQDTGYYIFGETQANVDQPYQGMVCRINENGDILWARAVGGEASVRLLGGCIRTDGSLVFGGSARASLQQQTDFYIGAMTTDGELIWEQILGGDEEEVVRDVCHFPDNEVIAVGKTNSFSGTSDDVAMLRLDSGGSVIWWNTYGGYTNEDAEDVLVNHNGDLIVVGEISLGGDPSNGYMMRVSPAGERLWNFSFGGPRSEFGNAAVEVGYEQYLVTGYTNSGPDEQGSAYLALMKDVIESIPFDTSGVGVGNVFATEHVVAAAAEAVDYTLQPVYPNPFNGAARVVLDLPRSTDLLLRVYDQLGRQVRVVYQGAAAAGRNEFRLQGDEFASGVYYLRASTSGAGDVTRSFVVLK